MEQHDALHFQRKLFDRIISLCGEKSALAELCDLLHLNKSSVYNRMKGEKLLRVDELLILVNKFGISMDEMILPEKDMIAFRFHSLAMPVRSCREYLMQVLSNFKLFHEVPDLKVWFSTSALPFFHHMHFRELALFKIFAYARINWQLPYTESLSFDPDTFPERDTYESLIKPILQSYSELPTIEFWSDNLYYTTLRQIRYFADAGQLPSPSLIQTLLEQLHILCSHQYEMAKQGQKWIYGTKNYGAKNYFGKFDLYYNEVAPLNITLLAESQHLRGVYAVFDDPNFMFSDNEALYDYTLRWMLKLRTKCMHISEDAEQNRRAYFNSLQEQIKAFRI